MDFSSNLILIIFREKKQIRLFSKRMQSQMFPLFVYITSCEIWIFSLTCKFHNCSSKKKKVQTRLGNYSNFLNRLQGRAKGTGSSLVLQHRLYNVRLVQKKTWMLFKKKFADSNPFANLTLLSCKWKFLISPSYTTKA